MKKGTFQLTREKFTECRHVGGGDYQARLVIDHQSFLINYPASIADAEWVRTQLTKALVRMLHGGKPPGKKNRRRVTFTLTGSGKRRNIRPT
jgi:hypothetical protein